MNSTKITTADHYGDELKARIETHNTAVDGIEADAASLEARAAELRDPATLTPGDATARLKALDKLRAERLALAVRRRDAAVAALALLVEIAQADNAEVARLLETAREREGTLREKLAALGVSNAGTVARAIADDPELLAVRAAAAQIAGGGRLRVRETFAAAREAAERDIAALLA